MTTDKYLMNINKSCYKNKILLSVFNNVLMSEKNIYFKGKDDYIK